MVVWRDSRMAYVAYTVAFSPMALTPHHLFPTTLPTYSLCNKQAGVLSWCGIKSQGDLNDVETYVCIATECLLGSSPHYTPEASLRGL